MPKAQILGHLGLATCVAMLANFAPGTARAQDGGKGPSVLIVHGIVGTDLGPNYLQTLPVDVQVEFITPQGDSGVCLKQAMQFGDTAGPIPHTGKIAVTLHAADIADPCEGPVLAAQKVVLNASRQVALVFAEGSGGPVGLVFPVTASNPVQPGAAPALVLNAANASAVDVSLTDLSTGGVRYIDNVAPGSEDAANIPAFSPYAVRVMPTATDTVLSGPQDFSADSRSVDLLIVVGLASNTTVQVIHKTLQGNF
jgi:hypothetical protein